MPQVVFPDNSSIISLTEKMVEASIVGLLRKSLLLAIVFQWAVVLPNYRPAYLAKSTAYRYYSFD